MEMKSDFEKYKAFISECTHPDQTMGFQQWFEETYYLPVAKKQYEELKSILQSEGVFDIDDINDFDGLRYSPLSTVVEILDTDNIRCKCIEYRNLTTLLYFSSVRDDNKVMLIPDVDYYPPEEKTIYNFEME